MSYLCYLCMSTFVCLLIAVSNTYCVVFVFVFVFSSFVPYVASYSGLVHVWLLFRYSLTFIYIIQNICYVFYGMVWFYSNYIYILYLNWNINIKSQKNVQKFETPFVRCWWKSGSCQRLSKILDPRHPLLIINHILAIKQCLSIFKSNESKGYTFVVLILANKELWTTYI